MWLLRINTRKEGDVTCHIPSLKWVKSPKILQFVIPGGQVEHYARPLKGERLYGSVALLEGVVPPERDLHLLRGDPPLEGDYLIQFVICVTKPVHLSHRDLIVSSLSVIHNINTVCVILSVGMFCFVFCQKFRLPIGLHSSCSISPMDDGICHKCFTKYHHCGDDAQCTYWRVKDSLNIVPGPGTLRWRWPPPRSCRP